MPHLALELKELRTLIQTATPLLPKPQTPA